MRKLLTLLVLFGAVAFSEAAPAQDKPTAPEATPATAPAAATATGAAALSWLSVGAAKPSTPITASNVTSFFMAIPPLFQSASAPVSPVRMR